MRRLRQVGVLATMAIVSLALQGGVAARATFPGDNGRIAYGRTTHSSHYRIVTSLPDGSDRVAITNANRASYAPTWSPDGSHIAFVRAAGELTIVVTAPDGMHRSVVVPRAGSFVIPKAAWAPDGSELAFCKSLHVYTVHVDGSSVTDITPATSSLCSPAWSSDGTLIAATSGDRVFNTANRLVTVNPDGTGLTVILHGGSFGSPDWSPDGTHLVFSRAVKGRRSDIYTVKIDGTELTDITNSPNRAESYPVYSPDGTAIMFSRTQAEGSSVDDLWIVDADGSGRLHRVTNTPHLSELGVDWQAR